jgi:hypothetical protein
MCADLAPRARHALTPAMTPARPRWDLGGRCAMVAAIGHETRPAPPDVCAGAAALVGTVISLKKAWLKMVTALGIPIMYHELYREHATVLPGGERRPTRSYGFTISESLACSRSLGRQHAGMSPYPVTSSGPPPGCRSSSGRRRGQASQQARVQYPRDAPAHLRHASAPLCLRPNWVPRSLSRFR